MPWLDHGRHQNCEGGFSLNHFCIISKPLMCATIWIKHLGIAIVASSRIKHGDWFMLVSKGTNNKWTYDLIDHLMANLEIVIALASMTCIGNLDGYELHSRDEKVFNDFINEC
jgi:hypothetical protein